MTESISLIETLLAPDIEYWVQCSLRPDSKSRYVRRATTKIPAQAWRLYSSLNIGNGYRKRLVAFSPAWGKRVLARASS